MCRKRMPNTALESTTTPLVLATVGAIRERAVGPTGPVGGCQCAHAKEDNDQYGTQTDLSCSYSCHRQSPTLLFVCVSRAPRIQATSRLSPISRLNSNSLKRSYASGKRKGIQSHLSHDSVCRALYSRKEQTVFNRIQLICPMSSHEPSFQNVNMSRMSPISLAGNVRTTTLTAFTREEFVEIVKKLP